MNGSSPHPSVAYYGGTCYGGTCRLAATLWDSRTWPADVLIALYHERREPTSLALRHTLPGGWVLRSGGPVRLQQERWPCWPSTRSCGSPS